MTSQTDGNSASLGSWVTVREQGDNETETFYLVDSREADFIENKLPPDNAMARALNGSKPGDEVVMDAPKGQVKFTVVDVGKE